jgi:hypothetical protein
MTDTDYRGFELDFVIKADHLVDFLKLRRRTLNRIGGLIAIALIAVGVYFVLNGDRTLGAFEILVGSAMLVTSQTRIFESWRVKRAGKAVIGTRARFQVDGSGIHIENAGQSGAAEWSEITDLKVNDSTIIPMRGRLPLGWMPTEAFASPEARNIAIVFMDEQMAKSRGDDPAKRR